MVSCHTGVVTIVVGLDTVKPIPEIKNVNGK